MKATCILAATAVLFAATSCGSKASRKEATTVPDIEVSQVITDSVTLFKNFPGTLSADASVNVVARVNGNLTGKYYNSGDFVKKGQTLFTIESTSYADAVKQAEASLATARSNYDYATRRRDAMEKAYASDAVSEMELEQSRSDERQAAASIKSAEAALSTARMNLSYCTVKAPIDGRAGDSSMSVGNYVGGGGSPVTLCEIYDNRNVTATFAIEDVTLVEKVNKALEAGRAEIPVTFGQRVDHSYVAALSYVAPEMNTSTGTMQLKAKIANPYDELRPGMYVNVSLPVGVDPQAILVRDASLSTDQLGKFLYTVNDSDKVVYTPVQTGELVGDSLRIINSGLRPGDRYVTSAMLKVREGMTINPIAK
ncbi:MAG: efflux RND transporter periplasmic adaptor subunit [Muribaculaceae bacterium]|nr:efflux RND transporter periplasmic adaptor subunit [Muribaculaceae bacterium]